MQIACKGAENYLIKGLHDVDKKWMTDVRNAGRERKLKSKKISDIKK